MGLRSDIQTELTAAFVGDLSDVVASFTLVKTTRGDYDELTDDYSETSVSYTSSGIFERVKTEEIVGNVKYGDEKLIINAIDISVAPEIDDEISLADGTLYNVISPNPVMGGGTTPIIYECIVRRNTGG